MIYGRDNILNMESSEDAAQIVSDAEMAEIVKAASTLRIEAHTADVADLADLAESVSYPALRVRGEVRGPQGRD
jgi:hypothetical protein